jgi:RNA-binding protein
MTLANQQIRTLRSRAHHLKPVVRVGDKGITDNLLVELNRALEDHELIKVNIAGAEREARQALTDKLCQASGAELVQMIGRISVLYRPSDKLKARFVPPLTRSSKQSRSPGVQNEAVHQEFTAKPFTRSSKAKPFTRSSKAKPFTRSSEAKPFTRSSPRSRSPGVHREALILGNAGNKKRKTWILNSSKNK